MNPATESPIIILCKPAETRKDFDSQKMKIERTEILMGLTSK
jgi:hypothetical protein